MHRSIVQTADGSNTLFVAELQEHYHSTYGAYNESQHIYIQEAFNYSKTQNPIVLEIGFGTGLNAMCTCIEAIRQKRKTEYITIEKYPILPQEITDLHYNTLWNDNEKQYFDAIHTCNWNTNSHIHNFFSITKLNVDVLSLPTFPTCSVVYFDAFAPEKQPELWTEDIFTKIYNCMQTHGVLTTYCVKGTIRRMLQSIGFTTEKIAGPAGGKREILRAVKR